METPFHQPFTSTSGLYAINSNQAQLRQIILISFLPLEIRIKIKIRMKIGIQMRSP